MQVTGALLIDLHITCKIHNRGSQVSIEIIALSLASIVILSNSQGCHLKLRHHIVGNQA